MTKKSSSVFRAVFLLVFIFFSASPVSALDLETLFSNISKHNYLSLSNLNLFDKTPVSDNLEELKLSDVDEIKKVYAENKLVLEEINSKPVVKILSENSESLKLSDKINQTKTATDNLYSAVQNLKSRSQLLAKKWSELTESEIMSELTILDSIFTQDVSGKDSNIIATTNWLKSSWDSTLLVTLSDEARATQNQISNLLNDTIADGKINNPSILIPALDHINKFEILVGTSLAKSTDQNLYGHLKKITDQVHVYDLLSQEGLNILSELKRDPSKYQTDAINNLNGSVLGANRVPEAGNFFSESTGTLASENKVLDLLALIETNKILMGSKTGQVIQNIWINNPYNVRVVASNPSRTQTQKITIKFSLPTEISSEQVVSFDKGLSINFDDSQSGLVATGELTLAPLESKVLTVSLEDVWTFSLSEINSLKSQVDELTYYLQDTNNSAKADTIKKEIYSLLDGALETQQSKLTPESRIVSYRSSAHEINNVGEKIATIMSLVLDTKGSGSILGVSSTLHSTPLKGIIFFFVVSLVFMAIYINAAKNDKSKIALQPISSNFHENTRRKPFNYRDRQITKSSRISKIVILTLISGGLGAMATAISIRMKEYIPLDTKKETVIAQNVLGTSTEVTPNKFPYEASTLPPKDGNIPVRSLPAISSPQITSLKEPQTISVFKKVDHWVLITDQKDKDSLEGWWIHDSFLQ